MMYYPTEAVSDLVATLPKNTKSKFINLCVELVISDQDLINKVKNDLIGLPLDIGFTSTVTSKKPANITQETNEQGDNSSKPRIVSRKKIQFKI